MSRQRSAELIAVYRQNLDTAPRHDSASVAVARAALLAALATMTAESHPDDAREYLGRVTALARRSDSVGVDVYARMARYATDLSPDALPQRRTLAGEVMDLLTHPECLGLLPDVLPGAYFMYVAALMESGDIAEVDNALSAEIHAGGPWKDLVRGRFADLFRCARATLDGNTSLAEALASDGHTRAAAAGDTDADAVWLGQIAVIRWMQGRWSELEELFVEARRSDPTEIIWAAAVIWIWVRQGRFAAAQGLLRQLPEITDIRRGRNWLAAVALLAEAACQIGSDGLIDRLRVALEPFADRLVPLGLGVTLWGTAARPLALIALRQGRRDDAIDWYRRAIELCSHTGSQTWLCQAQAELAELLFLRGEEAAASALIAEASSTARHLHFHHVDDIISRFGHAAGERPAGPDSTDDDSSPSDIQPVLSESRLPHISVLGEFSVTATNGFSAEWKSQKARTLLKLMIARRGEPLTRDFAIEMLWPDIAPNTTNEQKIRNRLAVAITTVRRALDPGRAFPSDHFVAATTETIRLRLSNVTVDIEEFFALSQNAQRMPSDSPDHVDALRRAFEAYHGEPLPEEIYELWSESLRRQAHLAFFKVGHTLARSLAATGNHYESAQYYQWIVDVDPYDQEAHTGLVTSLDALGAGHRARTARQNWQDRMAALGLSN